MLNGKLIILSAPSGAGKTTIMKHVVGRFPQLEFSVSATSRPPRGEEKHGVDYFFLDAAQFLDGISSGDFVEWEEVYEGTHYGTLRSEVERIWAAGKAIVFDVDVKGGIRLKNIFGQNALSIFIMPPSAGELRRRLVGRGTDSPQVIEKRLAKAGWELEQAPLFDKIIVNDDLQEAITQTEATVGEFLGLK